MLYNVLFILKFMNELDKKLSLDLSRVSTNVEFIKKGIFWKMQTLWKAEIFMEAISFHANQVVMIAIFHHFQEAKWISSHSDDNNDEIWVLILWVCNS